MTNADLSGRGKSAGEMAASEELGPNPEMSSYAPGTTPSPSQPKAAPTEGRGLGPDPEVTNYGSTAGEGMNLSPSQGTSAPTMGVVRSTDAGFGARWTALQQSFLENPAVSVTEANTILVEMLRGISSAATGEVSNDRLMATMQAYRQIFDILNGLLDGTPATAGSHMEGA